MGTIVENFKVSYLGLSFSCDLNAVAYGLWTNVGCDKISYWEREQFGMEKCGIW